MTEIFVVRHGRTTANAEGLLLGRLDPDLDEEGRRQAAAMGKLLATDLAGRDVRIVCSPLLRTRSTATAVAEALGGPDIVVDERWIELDYGELDGVAMASVPAETWEVWRTDAEFCPDGGECLSNLGRRVRTACDELAATPGTVVVVTHVSPIKAAVSWALGVDDLVAWRMYVAPGSLTRLAFDARGPSLRSFNQLA
jgi:broad specificity phosphatase PhoE